jgi:multidrug efflux pump subunit AcrA (membrane-fusion protein)
MADVSVPVRTAGVALFVFGSVSILLTGCSGEDEKPVTVAEAVSATVTEQVEAPGSVVARATATISSPATGRVVNLQVKEGQRVEAGQAMFVVDSPDAKANLRQAQQADREAASSTSSGSAPAGLAGRTARTRRQAEKGFATARKQAEQVTDEAARKQALAALDVAEAQFASSLAATEALVDQVQAGIGNVSGALASLGRAQRLQTRAAVTAAQRTVAGLTVKAPIAGTVSLTASGAGPSGGGISPELAQQAQQLLGGAGGLGAGGLSGLGGGGGTTVAGVLAEGTPVSSGNPLVTITDASVVSVAATVDETDVLLVKPGVKARIELDAVPGRDFPSAVASIDPAPTQSARGGVAFTIRMPLELDPELRALPGMGTVVHLDVRTDSGVATVPSSAVVRQGDAASVWLVTGAGDDRVTTRRAVTLGAEGEDRVAVLAGLKAGDRVVTGGLDRVREGQPLP